MLDVASPRTAKVSSCVLSVKSMQGQKVGETDFDLSGVVGDRAYGSFDVSPDHSVGETRGRLLEATAELRSGELV